MNLGETAGPTEAAIELIKAQTEKRVIEIARKIVEDMKMPEDWKKSEIITMSKNKGDVCKCGNHRELKRTDLLTSGNASVRHEMKR